MRFVPGWLLFEIEDSFEILLQMSPWRPIGFIQQQQESVHRLFVNLFIFLNLFLFIIDLDLFRIDLVMVKSPSPENVSC